jgi:cytoskeletal protein RodZ
MPLDTGAVTQSLLMSAGVDMSETPDDMQAPLEESLNIGATLRATRGRLGRSLQDIADATKIKRAYLEALEEMRLEDLPSRPFTIGYVRAYATALGLDGEAAVGRFKQDSPCDAEPLHAPVGVRKHADARLPLLAAAGAVVVSAVLVWNLAQRSVTDDSAPPAAVIESSLPLAPASAAPSTVAISSAQPAPSESTLPEPYVTPGLEAPDDGAAGDGEAAAPREPAGPATFKPHGQIYGAPAAASVVTLQARRPAALVIRGVDGSVYFARQLKAGEAYRAPMLKNLSVDVSETSAFDVYLDDQIGKPLTRLVTPLSQIAAAAPKPAVAAPLVALTDSAPTPADSSAPGPTAHASD